MDLGIPFLSNYGPMIPNPASVFVLHVRISRKVTSNFRKCAFSTLLGALPCLYRGSQNFSKAWNTSPDIYSETFSIKNPPKNSFFVSFAINSAICRISIVILRTTYNGNMTYCRIYGKRSKTCSRGQKCGVQKYSNDYTGQQPKCYKRFDGWF